MTATTPRSSTWTFPRFERIALGPGLNAVVCPIRGRGLVAVRVLSEGSPLAETAGQDGLAAITASALSEGSRERDSETLGQALDLLGANLGGSVDWESTRLGGAVPRDRWRDLVAIAGEVARAPRLPAEAVERLREERLNQLAMERLDPPRRAYDTLVAALYEPSARYARALGGEVDTVSRLAVESIPEFWSATARELTVVIAGDVEVDAAAAAVGAAFGTRPVSTAPAPAGPPNAPDAALTPSRRVIVVDRPGAAQSALAVGHVGRAIGERDPAATALLAQALGGGGMLTTRLIRKLREEKGYTYGAYSSLEQRRHRGPLACSTTVEGSATVDSVRDIHQEMSLLLERGLEPGELETVRRFVHGTGPIRWQTPDSVADAISHLVVHRLGDDHYDRYRAGLLEAGDDTVAAAAREEIHPEWLVTVVAGNAAASVAGLEALDIGPVTVVAED